MAAARDLRGACPNTPRYGADRHWSLRGERFHVGVCEQLLISSDYFDVELARQRDDEPVGRVSVERVRQRGRPQAKFVGQWLDPDLLCRLGDTEPQLDGRSQDESPERNGG